MLKKLQVVILMLCVMFGYAQQREVLNYGLEVNKPNSNYYQITNAVKPILEENKRNATSALEKKNAEKALKQFGRWQYYWQDRLNSDGTFNMTVAQDELSRLKPNTPFSEIFPTADTQKNTNALTWEQVGPVSNVLAHGYTAYPGQGLATVVRRVGSSGNALIGTSNGGIWKTTNIFSTTPVWTAKTDFLARIGISDIKIQSNNTTIFALTGDRDADRSRTIGVIKSTNTGDTWSTTALVLDPTISQNVTNLGMKPNNNNKMILFARVGNVDKYFTTSDGWATFQTVNSNVQYANDVLYTDDFILVSNIFGSIYKSVDDGLTFTEIYSNDEGAGNIALRFNQSPVNTDIYFLAAKKNAAKVYKLTKAQILAATAPIAATQVGTTLTDYNPQGTYNVAIGVSTLNPNRIFVLGVNGWYTTNGGTTWVKRLDAYSSATSGQAYVHPDHHSALYLDGSNWWITHDGGMHQVDMTSVDNATGTALVYDKTGNLQIGQIYHSAILPSESSFSNALLGLQDNDGFSKAPGTQGGQWVAVLAGDGTAAAINQTNPLIRFLGGTNGSLYRTNSSYAVNYNDQTLVIPSDTNAPFVSKAIVHNTNANYVFAGYSQLQYSVDAGVTFTGVTGALLVGPTKEIEQYGDRVAVVGSTGQKVANFTAGTFSNITDLSKPTGVTDTFKTISLSSTNNQVIYAGLSGYNAANKIYKSTDNGVTWTNITFDLPNVAVYKVLNKVTALGAADEVLYVATEVGVFYKAPSISQTWTKLGTNLPNVTVTDMSINYTQDKLYAATFGRGFWSIDISSITLSNSEVKALDKNDFNVYPVPATVSTDVFVKLPKEYKKVNYSIYNYVGGRLTTGTLTSDNNKLNTKSLTVGAYLVVFEVNNTQITKKIIIK